MSANRPYFASKNAELRALAAAGNQQAQQELAYRHAKQLKLSAEGKLGQLRAAALGEGVKPTRQPKAKPEAPAFRAQAVEIAAPVQAAAPAKPERLTLKSLDKRLACLEAAFGVKRF